MNTLGRSLRVGAGIGAGVLLALGAIGWMHTPSGLRFLAAAGVPCPVNTVTPEQVRQLRSVGLASIRGGAPAPVRPAPAGMQLDRTTEAEALALLGRAHAQCEAQVRGYRHLRCRGIDAGALALDGPPVSELWLSFGPAGRLVGVDVYRRGMDAASLRTVWSSAAARLRGALGAPTLALGDPAPEALAALPIQTARLQYRYADYLATVTASHLPHSGLSVREQYLSAKEDTIN